MIIFNRSILVPLVFSLAACAGLQNDDGRFSLTADYSNPQTLFNFLNSEPVDAESFEIQSRTECGDGGCHDTDFMALVESGKEEIFLSIVERVPAQTVRRCRDYSEDENSFFHSINRVNANSWESLSWHLGIDFVPQPDKFTLFCGVAIPGYSQQTILMLNQFPDIVYSAARPKSGAGSYPIDISIPLSSFLAIRGDGLQVQLQPVIEAAVEELNGRKCTTNAYMTCEFNLINGVLRMNLLAPGTSLTNRIGYWERSVWSFTPRHVYNGPDGYTIQIAIPNTSIRRWPDDRVKPEAGFVSVDEDDGFNEMRDFITNTILLSLSGERVDYSPVLEAPIISSSR
jgi:hypothetical protein